MDLKKTNALIFAILGTILNIILGNMAKKLLVPGIQFTSLGTIFTAAVYGPWYGALAGLLTSIVQRINGNVKMISLVFNYIAIGIMIGFIGKRIKFTYYNSLVIGLVVGIASGIIITLTNPFTYMDILSVVANNVVDKAISSLIVALIMNILANRFLQEGL